MRRKRSRKKIRGKNRYRTLFIVSGIINIIMIYLYGKTVANIPVVQNILATTPGATVATSEQPVGTIIQAPETTELLPSDETTVV